MGINSADLLSGVATATGRNVSKSADEILAANRVGSSLDTKGIADSVARLAADDPKAAANVLENLQGRLSPADLGALERDLPDSLRAQQAKIFRDNAPAGLTNEQINLVADLGQIGLDVIGLFDPTPISDGLNGLISLFRGDLLGAGISAVSMFPYIGDAAKLGKLGKWAETAANAVELAAKNPKFAQAAEPVLRKIKDALESIPDAVRNNLPESAMAKLDKMRADLARHFRDPVIDGRPQVYADGGSKGNWSAELNARNLKANTDYNVNGYVYKTDGNGRVTKVEGKLELDTVDRNGYQQRVSGRSDRRTGDEGGHLIASIFKGAGEGLNLVPMNGNFNKGKWKRLENQFATALKEGKDVQVDINVIYKGDNARPAGFSVRYVIDGVVKNSNLLNRPGG